MVKIIIIDFIMAYKFIIFKPILFKLIEKVNYRIIIFTIFKYFIKLINMYLIAIQMAR